MTLRSVRSRRRGLLQVTPRGPLFLVCSICRCFLRRLQRWLWRGRTATTTATTTMIRMRKTKIDSCFSPLPLPAALLLPTVVDTIIMCARRTANPPESWATWHSRWRWIMMLGVHAWFLIGSVLSSFISPTSPRSLVLPCPACKLDIVIITRNIVVAKGSLRYLALRFIIDSFHYPFIIQSYRHIRHKIVNV